MAYHSNKDYKFKIVITLIVENDQLDKNWLLKGNKMITLQ